MATFLSNISIGFYESKCLNEFNFNELKFYLKYADDIVAPLDKEQHWLNFLDFYNKKHPNIKYTIEN